MGIEELHRDPNESDQNMGYGSSRDGDANKQVPLVDLAQLRAEIDSQGFGSNIIDPQTGEIVDRPASNTPLDDMIHDAGEQL